MDLNLDFETNNVTGEGVDDLTPADYLYSSFPYSYKAESFATQFFNICNRDDGRTISTPLISSPCRAAMSNNRGPGDSPRRT